MGTEEALQQAEQKRCEALMAGDIDALAGMLSEDLVHIHLTGQVDGKAEYLAGVRDEYRFGNVQRGPLNIRVWGDTAIMVGLLNQQITVITSGVVRDIRAITTQSWHRIDGRWLQGTCHNAPVSA
jgi:ketosteroid isomerase-like protein